MTFAPAVIVTTPGDKRLARAAWIDAGYEQSEPFESEPVFIVVPKNATDDRINLMARRFDVDAAELRAKRDAPWCDRDAVNASLVALVGAM